MFKCERCQQSSQRPNRVVVERRMVQHVVPVESAGPRGGRGSQIVREESVCDACRQEMEEAPIERAAEIPRPKKLAPNITYEGRGYYDEDAA